MFLARENDEVTCLYKDCCDAGKNVTVTGNWTECKEEFMKKAKSERKYRCPICAKAFLTCCMKGR